MLQFYCQVEVKHYKRQITYIFRVLCVLVCACVRVSVCVFVHARVRACEYASVCFVCMRVHACLYNIVTYFCTEAGDCPNVPLVYIGTRGRLLLWCIQGRI